MAKYTDEFKLQIVQYYLQGNGLRQTAKQFGLHHSTVLRWTSRYLLHGEDGIKRRRGKQNYSVDFKLNAIKMAIDGGLSQNAICAQLNLPADSLLIQWLKRYRQYGVDGLTPTSKGRSKMKPPKTNKADHLKTKEELLAELQYLRMEMAVIKKLDALIREKEAQQKKHKSSQD